MQHSFILTGDVKKVRASTTMHSHQYMHSMSESADSFSEEISLKMASILKVNIGESYQWIVSRTEDMCHQSPPNTARILALKASASSCTSSSDSALLLASLLRFRWP